MNESMKPRFAVDLEEIERQLGHQGSPAQGPAPSPHPGTRGDPLAELAKIVGQDDPFGQILAGDRPARPRMGEPAGLDDLFEQRGISPGPLPGLRGTVSADHPGPYAAPAPAHRAEQGDEPDDGYDPDYDPPYYDPNGEAAEPAPARGNGRKKALLAVGAVLGMAGVGLAGAFALKGQGTILKAGGEPPLIQATNEPVKVAPEKPGGIEIPNQNKQIYERAQEGQTKVVNREEQPVDVRQAVRSIAAESTGATSPAPTSTGGLNLGEPRKVRTVSIRPDGTVISPDAPAAATQPHQQVASLQPPAVTPAPPAPSQASAPPTPAPVVTATPPAPTPAPRAASSTPSTGGGASPQSSAQPQASTPAVKPQPQAPQRVASAIPTAPAAGAPPTATQAVVGGGFAVQLGVSSSEAEAKATLQRMQAKYSDLSGIAPMIRKAEVNGNTVFRVRVGPLGRDEASSLCSKIQGQGGQCFVAKN